MTGGTTRSPRLAGANWGGREEGERKEGGPRGRLAWGGKWRVDLALALDPNPWPQPNQPCMGLPLRFAPAMSQAQIREAPQGWLRLTPGRGEKSLACPEVSSSSLPHCAGHSAVQDWDPSLSDQLLVLIQEF